MNFDVFIGLTVPFVGTALGAAMVFFMQKELSVPISRALTGFAAGVMTAASVWSLIIPAIEQSAEMGRLSFLPALIGFWLGVLFLLLLDRIIPRLRSCIDSTKSPKGKFARTTMLVLAVTLHNIPEGMAVGAVYAGFLAGTGDITAGGAFALALGIAIQNFPEGAIISAPLHAEGRSKTRSFLCGMLSGTVEPLFGGLTVLCAAFVIPAMPYLLSFAAGAMVYVVAEELIPEMSQCREESEHKNTADVQSAQIASHPEHSHIGVLGLAAGFTVMMALDVALG